MRYVLGSVVLAAALFANGGVSAADRTVTLAVENMTCAACPFIVRKSLAAVPGVSKAEVSFRDKSAIVTFDDQKTTAAALTAATTNAGYPSRLRE